MYASLDKYHPRPSRKTSQLLTEILTRWSYPPLTFDLLPYEGPEQLKFASTCILARQHGQGKAALLTLSICQVSTRSFSSEHQIYTPKIVQVCPVPPQVNERPLWRYMEELNASFHGNRHKRGRD